MGMRSSVIFQEIKITDLEGLNDYFEKIKNHSINEYVFDDGYYIDEMVKSADIDEENLTLEFDWEGWKINGYFYDYFLTFCRDVAQFIEGEILLKCEEAEQDSRIIWFDNECRIEIGVINWSMYKTEKLSKNLPAVPEFLQKKLFLKKL